MDEENTECFITEKKGRNLIFENLVELKVIEGLDLSDDFLKKKLLFAIHHWKNKMDYTK